MKKLQQKRKMLKLKNKYKGKVIHTLETVSKKNLELLENKYYKYISKYCEKK